MDPIKRIERGEKVYEVRLTLRMWGFSPGNVEDKIRHNFPARLWPRDSVQITSVTEVGP